MRALRVTFASAMLALLACSSSAQDAVLVLSPSASVSVRAGTGTAGFGGDNANATAAQLARPSALAQDSLGNLYLADTRNHRIRRINPNGLITTVAGNGAQGFLGDGGLAIQAQLDSPSGIAIAADGTLVIADTRNHRIRQVDMAGVIHTIAGIGTAGFTGDGGLASAAQLSSPLGVAIGLAGDLYVADSGNHRIRHIDSNGKIATVAGNGTQGSSVDGTSATAPQLATAAQLDSPSAVTVRADGSVLIADRRNDRVLVLNTDGTLSILTTASVSLRRPSAVATNTLGDTLIADTGNYRVTQISSNGVGSVLGSGEQGALNPAAPPITTPLGAPASVVASALGSAAQFTAVDRDSSQVLQVAMPQLTFPDTVVATTSATRSLLLHNAGTASVKVTALSIPSAFSAAATATCGAAPFSIPPGASCTLDLAFAPQTDASVSALLEIDADNAPPQRVLMLGTGLRTGTQLPSTTSLQSSGTLDYAGMPVNFTAAVLGGSATAATGTVTFLDGTTELGSSPLNAAAQATFTSTGLAAGSHVLTARYNGDAHYLGSASTGVPMTVVSPPDFTIAPASSARVTMQSGNAGVLSLVLQPVNGVLDQTVTITTSGLPTGTAITVAPIPVALASSPANVSIAFKLPVSLSTLQHPAALFSFLLLPIVFRRRKGQGMLVIACLGVAMPLLLQGCGGGYLSGNNVGAPSNGSTYAVTVTASCPGVTGATLTHSTTFTVVVQ